MVCYEITSPDPLTIHICKLTCNLTLERTIFCIKSRDLPTVVDNINKLSSTCMQRVKEVTLPLLLPTCGDEVENSFASKMNVSDV